MLSYILLGDSENPMIIRKKFVIATFFGGVLFVYVIKKLLSFSYNRKKLKTSAKSEGLISTNNSHYQNGKAIKLNGNTKNYNSVNNNESDESEVIEEIIQKKSSEKPLENGWSSSSDQSISTTESDDRTTDEVEEVTETVTKTQANNPFKSEIQAKEVTNLAAIILTDDKREDWFEMICITSGSDVIDARNLKPEFVVIDCRGPVLARRCLIRYLYKELNHLVKHEIKEEDSLFSAIPASNRFELKKNFKFSLFLSDPPDNCATKADIIKRVNGPRTKRRDSNLIRLKSTTDKISVWNQVGCQGSLLSHFIDPIFISNIIIPVEFNQKSFHQHFLLNYTKEPKLSKCDNNLIADITQKINRVRVNGQQNIATNWIKTEDSLEIIDCKTGKAIKDVTIECTSDSLSISRLSKHELNKCFRDFLTNYEYNLRPHQSLPMTYRKWKESAPNYRIQKQLLKVRYAVAGRQWICLPSDLDMFV